MLVKEATGGYELDRELRAIFLAPPSVVISMLCANWYEEHRITDSFQMHPEFDIHGSPFA